MTFEIEINGRVRRVVLEPARAEGPARRFTVRVDDTAVTIDAQPTHLGWSILYPETGRSVEVALTEGRKGAWTAELPRVAVVAQVDGRRSGGGADGSAAAHGEQRILAPMPGRVVKVLVRPGDEVAARQGLVVVEAMKMENELSARRAGRVREVAVTPGTSVEAGRLLVLVV
jgi:biotin carboxyl carrier protein